VKGILLFLLSSISIFSISISPLDSISRLYSLDSRSLDPSILEISTLDLSTLDSLDSRSLSTLDLSRLSISLDSRSLSTLDLSISLSLDSLDSISLSILYLCSLALCTTILRSFGSVHKAVHKTSGYTIAIKIVQIDFDADESSSIQKEINILKVFSISFQSP
jgi:hypothetical protein